MRTTLDIDDDILEAAKDLAKAEKKTAGQVLSELARKALMLPRAEQKTGEAVVRNGFTLLPAHGVIVTKEFVDELIHRHEDD